MKGLVFAMVEDVVSSQFSESMWDSVVREAGVGGAYASLGTYDDDELLRIVSAVCAQAALSFDDVLRFVGTHGFAFLAQRVPEFMEQMAGWTDVLMGVEDIVHTEVRNLYPGAVLPGFEVTLEPGGVRMHYTSERSMCAMAEGLAIGAGMWFGRELAVEHVSCLQNGDQGCVLFVREAAA